MMARKTTDTIDTLREELKTARELNDEMRGALRLASEERARFLSDANRWHSLYDSQIKYNKRIADELQHQERLVRTLVDALADKYYPPPTNINVQMDYRIAKDEESPF